MIFRISLSSKISIIFSTEPIGIQTEALEEEKPNPENEPIISEEDTLENEEKIIKQRTEIQAAVH